MLSYDLQNKGDKLTMNDTNSCYILFILLCLREIDIKNAIVVYTYY